MSLNCQLLGAGVTINNSSGRLEHSAAVNKNRLKAEAGKSLGGQKRMLLSKLESWPVNKVSFHSCPPRQEAKLQFLRCVNLKVGK